MAQIGANKLPETDLLMFALVQEHGEGLKLKPRFPEVASTFLDTAPAAAFHSEQTS